MQLSTETLLSLLAELSQSKQSGGHSVFKVGKWYLIRTATMTDVGRVSAVADGFVTLEDAAWLADSGRFSVCLERGTYSEAEAFPDPVSIPLTSIIDSTPWRHGRMETQ